MATRGGRRTITHALSTALCCAVLQPRHGGRLGRGRGAKLHWYYSPRVASWLPTRTNQRRDVSATGSPAGGRAAGVKSLGTSRAEVGAPNENKRNNRPTGPEQPSACLLSRHGQSDTPRGRRVSAHVYLKTRSENLGPPRLELPAASQAARQADRQTGGQAASGRHAACM